MRPFSQPQFRDVSVPCTKPPSTRTLNILARISPIKSASDVLPLPNTPLSPVSSSGSASSRSSSRSSHTAASSSSSCRRGRKNSVVHQFNPELDSLTALNTTLNPLESIRYLGRRRWHLFDAQYFLFAGLVLFSLAISPSAPLIKTAAVVAGVTLMLIPATGQFLIPGAGIWTYLIFFFLSKFIPMDWRPAVSVKVLPWLETVIFGTSLSHFFQEHTHPILDVLAWLPYGVAHFLLPAAVPLALFLFGAPGSTPTFARTFGWLSLIGVMIAIFMPTTPPWYEVLHGLETPATYGMGGSPAGLARIDALFGADMYTTSFTTNPLPFGAFPSLHGGNAVLEALFLSHAFPRLRWPAFIYVCWIWWATMYLGHHYAVDLIGGGSIALVCFLIARRWYMPRAQFDKPTRWDYAYVEIGSCSGARDLEAGTGLYSSAHTRYAPLHRNGSTINLKNLRRGSDDSNRSAWSLSRAGSATSASFSGSSSASLSDDDMFHPSEKQRDV